MAVLKGWRFLDSAKINRIVRILADELESNQSYIFLERTPVVSADDDEIIGKFNGQFFAADVIADDQAAVIYDTVGKFEFVANHIPNLKMGSRIGQSMINRLNRLRKNLGTQQDIAFLTDWENRLADQLVVGIRQRMNALICAMQLDSVTYDRWGIKLTGAGWGMPADLKVTPAQAWSTDGINVNNSATPVSDLQILAHETAADVHGEVFDRVTMSSQTFRFLTQNAEFQSRISGELRYSFGANEVNVRDTGAMRQLLANIINMEVEIYDGSYFERSNSGVKTRVRVLPSSKVILSSSQDDGDAAAMDFANGMVTESIVAGVAGLSGISDNTFGPIAYYTSPSDLNPPEIQAWAVARGFPRKHRETATAVLTVGTY